jgi:hypothetical protein
VATGHPPLGLVLWDHPPGFDVLSPALDALEDAEVVLDVFEGGLLGESIEDLLDLLLALGGGRPGTRSRSAIPWHLKGEHLKGERRHAMEYPGRNIWR